ncbi:MAG: polysaccharide deacetylase family protein [Ruminococcaceae bacterium]|nr:polysaccharide deacetylase family protein [Oscillospiraceae bacterium]
MLVKWPNDARIAVSFAFDVDLELNWSESNRLDPGHTVHMSKGTYGAKQGLPRILKMLDETDIKATFFIPGVNAEKYPEIVKTINRKGHEIAYHGYHHYDKPIGSEYDNLAKCEKIFESLGCERPYGYRPTEAEFTDELAQILLERGYRYVSYRGNWDGPQIVKLGEKSIPLVDLEADVFFDDTAYNYYIDSPPARYGLLSASDQFEVWRDEFDALALEGGKVIDFIIHPQFSGRSGRVLSLTRLICYMKTRGAWITTNLEIADHVLKQHGLI